MSDYPDTAHILDSTIYDNDGSKKDHNEPVETLGKFGHAQDFDGSNDYIDTTDFDIEDDFTISMWINPSSTVYQQSFIAKQTTNCDNIFVFGYYKNNDNEGYSFHIRENSFRDGVMETGWQYMTYVGKKIGSSVTNAMVYKNGELLWQRELGEVAGNILGKPWTIGQDWDPSGRTDHYHGIIDELRIANYQKDNEWIATEYTNQQDPQNFIDFSPEEGAP